MKSVKELVYASLKELPQKDGKAAFAIKVAKTDAGTMVVLVDASKETQQVSSDGNLGAVFVLCLAVVYVLVRLVSKRAIHPFVEENVERQQQFIIMPVTRLRTPLAVLSANTVY